MTSFTVTLGDVTQGFCDPLADLFSEPRDKVLIDVEDRRPAVDRPGHRPVISGEPRIEDLLCTDHFVSVDEDHRKHVNEKRDRLLVASLGEQAGGLAKDPVVLGLCSYVHSSVTQLSCSTPPDKLPDVPFRDADRDP